MHCDARYGFVPTAAPNRLEQLARENENLRAIGMEAARLGITVMALLEQLVNAIEISAQACLLTPELESFARGFAREMTQAQAFLSR